MVHNRMCGDCANSKNAGFNVEGLYPSTITICAANGNMMNTIRAFKGTIKGQSPSGKPLMCQTEVMNWSL